MQIIFEESLDYQSKKLAFEMWHFISSVTLRIKSWQYLHFNHHSVKEIDAFLIISYEVKLVA